MLRELLTLDELRKLNWTDIESLQNKRLAATTRHLLSYCHFYREFFKKHKVRPEQVTCPEDWKRLGLPLIKKRPYINNPRDFIVRPQGKSEKIFLGYLRYVLSLNKAAGLGLLAKAAFSKVWPRYHDRVTHEVLGFFRPKMPAFAGGTESGRPVPVLITAKQKREQMLNTADISACLIITRHLKESRKGITGMNLFPYAPHIAWQIINMAAELRTDLNLCTAAGGFLNTDKLVAIAKSAKPDVYSGMVDYLTNIFLPRAKAGGVKLSGKVVFLNGATKMHEVQREQIKQQFRELGAKKVIALDGYGASELKEATLAECEEHSGLHHVAPLSDIIRTVRIGEADPDADYIYDWDFTSEEEGGYAAVWNIDGAGTLLEGYLLGDHYERTATDKCPHCGLNVQRVYNINRIADRETALRLVGVDLEKVDGAIVNLTALREQVLGLKEVREAQLSVVRGERHDAVEVRYVPCGKDCAAIKKAIEEIFNKFSDVRPCSIEKTTIDELYKENSLKYLGITRRKK